MKAATTNPHFDAMTTSRSTTSTLWLWAFAGLVFSVFSFSVFGQWLLSAIEFSAPPITAADAMPGDGLLRIRILEVISTTVMLLAFAWWLLRPLLRSGTLTIQALLLIGALISYVLDTTVNYGDYWMAWNKHAFNFGTWASFFPGHSGPTRYAEALFWGPPMYVYFGVGLGSIQLALFDAASRRIGAVAGFALSFAAAFAFDFVAESTIIQVTQAYAWPSTVGGLSAWAGTQFQFPLYESLLVAIYSSLYLLLLKSARESSESFIERGASRIRSAVLRHFLRLLAATGFATLCTIVYFGGFNLISQHADSRVEMPHYLQYSDEGWAQHLRP